MSENGFRFGDWQIDPDSNTLRNGEASANIEPKAMDVLRYLCRHAGAVIPPEELLQACWGNAELGDNPIHKAITQLRRALGDSASEPRYIETVRKRGYRAIAAVLAGEAALEGSWQQGSPFRGLESFQESHAAIFFGRMQATAQLRELVLKQTSDGCAMALVLGPSGSGKTSLVRAGLLPGLMASRTGSGEPVALTCTLYMDCADLADGNLFQALAAVLIDAEVGGKLLFAGENAEELGRWLESSDASTIAGRLAEASGKIKIGLFVDRLEAIFRAPGVTDQIRSRFIAVLAHLAVSRAVLVMLACRNDFYPEVIALPLLMALKSRGGHFDLNPPDGAEIAQMVRMPAKAAGLKFEVDAATGAALDDVLCDAARGNPDTLPLLQYCLDELYRQRSEDGTLRFEVFRELGTIEGAIAVRAEQVVSGLSSAQAGALPLVLSSIVDVADDQGCVTARRAAWSALPNAETRELIQALVEARLFVSELSGDVPSFGMAHEALLRRWPRVSNWVEQHRHALQLRTRIGQDSEKWLSAGKPRDLLLPAGIRVNQARELVALDGISLSPQQIEYIQSSLSRVRFAERIRVLIMIIIASLAIIAALLGTVAYRAQQVAEQRRNDAEDLMGYMLGNFVEKLRPIGKLDLLDDISSRALSYLTTTKELSSASFEHRAKALQIIAEVNIARSRQDNALQALEIGREILIKQESSGEITASLLRSLGENSAYIGQIYHSSSNLPKAREFFLNYLSYAERLLKLAPNAPTNHIEVAYAHNSLGSVALSRNNLDEASEYFSKSIKLEREIIEQHPTDSKLKADLANSLSWLASTKVKQGNLQGATTLFTEEEAILTSLNRQTPDNANWARRLASTQWRQAELLEATGNQPAAAAKYDSAEMIFSKLIAVDPSNKSWKLKLHTLQLKKLFNRSNLDEKKFLLEKLNEIEGKLLSIVSDGKPSSDLIILSSLLSQRRAAIYNEHNDTNEAILELEKARRDLSQLYQREKNNNTAKIHLANTLISLADLKLSKSQDQERQDLCQEASKIMSQSLDLFDYQFLVTDVKLGICLKNKKQTTQGIKSLAEMSYREPNYLRYISNHYHPFE